MCPEILQKLKKKILIADPEIQAFVILSHNTAKTSHFAKYRMFRKLNLIHFHRDIILHDAAKSKKHLRAGPGPILGKIRCLGIRCFIKKSSSWKFFFNLNQKCQNKLLMKGVFDLHQPFLITQVPFCQSQSPFYWRNEPFFKNSFIQFFHFK